MLGGCKGKGEPEPPKPVLKAFDIESEIVNFQFGESPEEAGILLGQELPDDFEPRITLEPLTFNGHFEIDDRPFLSGSATAQLSDGSTSNIDVADVRIQIKYREVSLTYAEDLGTTVLDLNGELVPFERIYERLRSESSSEGLSALSDVSRSLVILSAFWHVKGVQDNVAVARALDVSDDDIDYSWWCEATAKVGAIAMAGLGAAACYALLAGCAVAGGVTLNGLGVVGCVAAAGICGAVSAGLVVLVGVLKEFLWGDPADVEA